MRKNLIFNVLALLCPKIIGVARLKAYLVKDVGFTLTPNSDQLQNEVIKEANEDRDFFEADNKHNLSLLNALTKSEIRQELIKRKYVSRSMVALSFFIVSLAHGQVIAPLKIGDKIPASILNTAFPVFKNGGKLTDSLKISSYTGKIILFDFWATWCSTCIYKFPLLEELQKKYKDDLVVVLVNSKSSKDTPVRIQGLLSGEKAPYIKSTLFTLYGDTLLDKIFPHRYLPHYAWIGKDATLKLLSSAEMLNAETINALLHSPLKTPQK